MKKLYMTLLLITVGLIFSTSVIYAEMAKEGSGHYRSGKNGTFDVIALGKNRFQLNYDETGAIVEAPDNSPLENATYRTIGTQHGFEGKFKGNGGLVLTRPNGDHLQKIKYHSNNYDATPKRNIKTAIDGDKIYFNYSRLRSCFLQRVT
ncbi:MAG: hypothetical protein JRF56_08100 [Deltaproteobacteria bacterium]|jgi:hypothetical protein|nr:hypothetical protein [Deltaproteobacteria bacterium]